MSFFLSQPSVFGSIDRIFYILYTHPTVYLYLSNTPAELIQISQ